MSHTKRVYGIDIVPEYYEMVKQQLQPVELYLFEPKTNYGSTEHKISPL